jgi:hypothetical protein
MITDTDTSGEDDDEWGRVRDEWEKDNLKWPAGVEAIDGVRGSVLFGCMLLFFLHSIFRHKF